MGTSKSYSVHKLEWPLDFGRDRFEECARTAPWGLGKWPEFGGILDVMRTCIPVKGTRDWIKDIHVLVEPGKCIPSHKHSDEWTAIWYVDPGDPVCAIIIEGERVEPEPGDVIVLKPGVEHAVETSKSERTRISFAMLVEG